MERRGMGPEKITYLTRARPNPPNSIGIKFTVLTLLLLSVSAIVSSAKNFYVNPDSTKTTIIEPEAFQNLEAGDTIFLVAGKYKQILIRNIKGTPTDPIIITNSGRLVHITDGPTYGIAIRKSSNLVLTGNPLSELALKITDISNGNGISVEDFSSDVEIYGIEIRNVNKSGIMVKSDPSCRINSPDRSNFILKNISIHHNLIYQTGDEGFYIGSSFYGGVTLDCSGQVITKLPHIIENLSVYKNTLIKTGKDAIQISSIPEGSEVFENSIWFDSEQQSNQQMSGIFIGGGAKSTIYNNFIKEGSGSGIEVLGKPGTLIFNNIIINPGKSYKPELAPNNFAKHGIYVKNALNEPDFTIQILNNTILNPKTNGITIDSPLNNPSQIKNNAIINPGAYLLTRSRSFIFIEQSQEDVSILTNYMGLNSDSLFQVKNDFDYYPSSDSPLINAGSETLVPDITFDFLNRPRPMNNQMDIGAVEYQELIEAVDEPIILNLFPNPTNEVLNVVFSHQALDQIEISLYTLEGKQLTVPFTKTDTTLFYTFELQSLPRGVYKVVVKINDSIYSKTFIKR